MMGCGSKQVDTGLPFYNTPDFTPHWIGKTDSGYRKIHTIAPFSFTNQLGKRVDNSSLKGKIYVANFFFASCATICPKMMSNLDTVQQTFMHDNRVVMLSHSVTPARDSVPVLFKYADDHHINSSKWWLLTGDKDAIYTLARRSYFADEELGYNKDVNQFLHTENVVLVDGQGRIRGVYNGNIKLEMFNLIKHIKILEAEERTAAL